MIDGLLDGLTDRVSENLFEGAIRGYRSAVRPVQILPGQYGSEGANHPAIRTDEGDGGGDEGLVAVHLAMDQLIPRQKEWDTDDSCHPVAWEVGSLCRRRLDSAGEPTADQGTRSTRVRFTTKFLDQRAWDGMDLAFDLMRIDDERDQSDARQGLADFAGRLPEWC